MPNYKNNKRKKTNRPSGYGRKTGSLAKSVTAEETAEDTAHVDLNTPKPSIRVIDLSDPIYVSNLIREQKKPNYTLLERLVLFLARRAVDIMIMGSQLMQVAGMIGLIFGGCCSNVFALEAIVKSEPDSGLLITLIQFLLVAIRGYYEHFSIRRPPFFLKPNKVPLGPWFIYVLLFFAVNLLNNFAFGFNISVPVHIILRSGGSVTTMVVGWLWGKTYSRLQVISVALLTIGVVISAMADAEAKGKTSSSSNQSRTTFLTGLSIIFLAQILSAIMGLYVQRTYERHGSHWREGLFYSHFLALPLFIPFYRSLTSQTRALLSSPPLFVLRTPFFFSTKSTKSSLLLHILADTLKSYLPSFFFSSSSSSRNSNVIIMQPPRLLVALLANALTQYGCIRGVNLLAARTSALTVTIVLNIRKLVSLLLSVWLFGNALPDGVVLGAVVVFGAGALYAWESQRLGKRRRASKESGEERLKGE